MERQSREWILSPLPIVGLLFSGVVSTQATPCTNGLHHLHRVPLGRASLSHLGDRLVKQQINYLLLLSTLSFSLSLLLSHSLLLLLKLSLVPVYVNTHSVCKGLIDHNDLIYYAYMHAAGGLRGHRAPVPPC